MRTDNFEFATLNIEASREPRFVFVLDFGGEDLAYFTSHAVIGLSGENVYEGVLTTAAGTSQKLDPLKANSEIGSINFGVLDDGLTELQRDRLEQGKGLRGKTVRFYVGFSDLDWSEYILATTQIIDSVSFDKRAYTFKTADIQRSLREDIFTELETTIAESIGPQSSYIRVASAQGFQTVLQPNVEGSLWPGKRVGFVEIEGGDDDFEIITFDEISENNRLEVASTRSSAAMPAPEGASSLTLTSAAGFRSPGWGVVIIEGERTPFSWTGVSGHTLTGCDGLPEVPAGAEVRDVWGRGTLYTPVVTVDLDETDVGDSAPTLREFIYLEMPGPMLMYALLTGYLYGYPGEQLPPHWTLGISPEFVRTADFLNISPELWDPEDRNKGLIVRFERLEEEDGKQFIEEQLARMMGLYMPIDSMGQIGLRRMTGVLSDGGYVRRLTEDQVVQAGALQHDMSALTNEITVSWNWSIFKDRYTRLNAFVDTESIAVHGRNAPLQLEFRGLYGGKHSRDTLVDLLNGLRDRYAGPPLKMSLTLTPDQNDLEVGDIVRVDLESVKDYTGSAQDGRLSRNFEIQNVQTDWRTGQVKVQLFGSSQRASALLPSQSGYAVPDSAYEHGTEISPENFPGAVTRSGAVTRIISDIHLTGRPTLLERECYYWCPGDLTVDAGVRITIDDNVGVLVRGYFSLNGEIDGVGAGHPGALGTSAIAAGVGVAPHGSVGSVWTAENIGAAGHIDIMSTPQAGTDGDVQDGYRPYLYTMDTQQTMERQGAIVHGETAVTLQGLKPSVDPVVSLNRDLRGGGGSGGGAAAWAPNNRVAYLGPGGNGGDGGAGLMIVCRGMEFGQRGRIDLSGASGQPGGQYLLPTGDGGKIASGAGGPGGPGACYIFVDGTSSNPPTLTRGQCVANGGDLVWTGTRFPTGVKLRADKSTHYWSSGEGPDPMREGGAVGAHGAPGASMWQAAFRITTLAPDAPIQEDEPTYTENPLRIILTELTNTPRSANANLSTIEVGIVAPPSSNFLYALIEYRPKGEQGWFEVGPASPEVGFVVPSDGTTYEVRARGVSRAGVVNPVAQVYEITTTRILQPGQQPDDDDEPETVARVPDVSGLELFEQGHDTVFGGRDAKFVWRKTSVTEWFEIGGEGRQGAGAGALDLYFKDYQVEIWVGAKLLRTEWVVDSLYTYTFEKNAEDYYRINRTRGAWREFECRVYCRGRQNQLSGNAATLIVENPAPEMPDQIAFLPSLRSIEVRFKAPDDLDYRHTRVWLSTEKGFEPSDDTLAAQVDGSVAIQGLTDGTTYYIRLASYDEYGQGPMSPEFAVTTQTLQVDDIEGLPDDLAGIGGDLAAIQQELDSAMDDLADQAQELAAAGSAIINLQEDYESLEGTVAGHTLAILAADARIEDTEDGLVVQGQQITLIEAGLQTVTDEVVAAQDAAEQAALEAAAAAGIAESKGKVLIQSAEPSADDRLPQNLWIDTADGANTPKRWSGSQWEAVTDRVAIDAAHSAAQAQADAEQALLESSAQAGLLDALTVRVKDTEDGLVAESARLTGVETRVGDNEAGVTQLMESTAGLEAQYVLAVRSGGVVTGMKIAAGEDVSRIIFETDELLLIPTGGDPDSDSVKPFLFDGEWIRINKLKVGSINYDDNSIDLATKVTGRISGDNIEDGAIINLTGKSEAPGRVIFTGDDDNQWIDIVSIPVQVIGAGSALAVQYHFGFTIDQVSKTYAQAGPGGPIVEMRVMRDDVIVWTPDPMMVSGSGRVSLQFTSRIDTGATPGLHNYKIQIRWKKGSYDAGTVDYTVAWSAAGQASLNFLYHYSSGAKGLVFNGCQPTTYLGEGWELTFPGTGAEPLRLTGAPSVVHTATPVPTDGWVDWRTYCGFALRAPSLDRDPQPASSQRFVDQPYEAINHDHCLKGTLSDLWILAFEYRG